MIGIEFTVDWKNFEAQMSKLERFPQHVFVLTKQITRQTLEDLIETTPRSARQDKEHLADKWDVKTSEQKDAIHVLLYNRGTKKDEKVLGYLEEGTPAHLITPKNKKGRHFLKFEWLANICFARQVEHPGTKAYRMIANARADLVQRFDAAYRELAKRFARNWRDT